MKSATTEELAKKIRIHAVNMVNKGGSSHIGSILSIVDILAVLYGDVMNYKVENLKWKDRDRFILSKGHAGVGVYAVLAECGFFDIRDLDKHYQNGSVFSGHVSHKGVPGVEFSTGSLGHGLPVSSGIALAAKINNQEYKTYVLLSDGELNEGSNWESLLFSSHHGLNKLIAIIDRNRLQSMKPTEETLSLEPLVNKLEAFGWHVVEVDGHDHGELNSALLLNTDKPLMIVANTVKGKGVSFMENKIEWHYKTPKGKYFKQAIQDIIGKT
jgi:transketolase